MTDENDTDDATDEQTEPTDPRADRDFNQGRQDSMSSGTEIRGKVKRGTDTRDQDELVIKGRGATAEEAAADFEEALDAAENGDWAQRLRNLRASTPGDGDDGAS